MPALPLDEGPRGHQQRLRSDANGRQDLQQQTPWRQGSEAMQLLRGTQKRNYINELCML
jgi:hypothetical protein